MSFEALKEPAQAHLSLHLSNATLFEITCCGLFVSDTPGVTPLPGTSRPGTRQSRAVTAMSQNRRFSTSQEKNVNKVQKHVHNRLEHIKPRKVKIDGFRLGDEIHTGPYAWQITTPIK